MNSKGLSENVSIIIKFIIAFLVVLILTVIAISGTKNAGTAIGADPSTGFDLQKEDFCNKACAKDTTGNCGDAVYEGTITCRQHMDGVQKTLEVTYTPTELSSKPGENKLTITVRDSKTKALKSGAAISVTYHSGTINPTNADGVTEVTFVIDNIPKTSDVGNIEGTVKLAGYPDATFNVLVRA